MKISFQIIIAGIIVLIIGVLGIFLLIPTEKTKRDRLRKEAKDKADEPPVKDWQAVSLKLERHIQALRTDIEEYQKKERILDRDLTVQKEKYTKLQEKLVQERDWQKKEEDDREKKANEILAMKNNLRNMEHELGTMHSERLRFQRELQEAKSDNESANAQRRDLQLQVAKLAAENESLRKELKEMKWENARLAEKKDAQSWIPKQDFEKLEAELRNKEKDLARLREQIKKEGV